MDRITQPVLLPLISCATARAPTSPSSQVGLDEEQKHRVVAPTENSSFPLVPCPPANITPVHTCAPDPVPVSWVASNGANYYTAVALSSGGNRSQCVTNTTSCSFPGFQCGDVYNITVSGSDNHCEGPPSSPVTLATGKNPRMGGSFNRFLFY